MKIKRFFAKDMRTALSEVKEELGPDAVIMSNKKVSGGVEIVAAVDVDTRPPAAQSTQHRSRDEVSQGLSQARRKLADDKVQLNQSTAQKFASVLQNYASTQEQNEQPNEVDSLSALLDRQSKLREQGDIHSLYSEANAFRHEHKPAYSPQNERSSQQKAGGYSRYSDQQYADAPSSRDNRSPSTSPLFQRSQPEANKHDLDIGDYRRPSSKQYERDLSVGRGLFDSPQHDHGMNGREQSPQKPRLDPSRYEPKAQPSKDELDQVRSEMLSIRRLLEHQLSGLMWQEVERREPMRAMMIKRLEKMGLSEQLADQLACYIPEDIQPNEAWPALLDLLSDQIITTDDCILDTGGVVALLGPTGVGKTTTIAKLAARAAMEFGPDQIALVTTDTYRIGAHEQLATYGRIMGCPVRVAKDAEELADILHQLRHRRLVLLDTAGMGQRDIRLSEQLDTLMKNSGAHIRSYLVMPATSQRRVLQETIEHFRRIPLSGCVLTKLDESLSLGEIICVAIQNALPIAYLADGQRVPEDIKIASGNYLVSRANELLEIEISQQSHFWSSDSSDNKAADYYD
ncbi:flagellar biosynthesis regulator FlhF [Photobacterium angustum]|uniref:flagellar biosynthesis protein FlhF n=1 Tax=Photobacterium angustum TaxID=661 RepID=UPI0005E014F6|nr:flagellar biosynthesis protein FlhF [Photobacterium angustum]KJG07451.1 flagellar biosynthesis regulator FlhF [Photobacterium angustum]PSV96320.1 flagellar biosynthesis protein FlhF [Photobacterium angustum]